MRTFKLIPLLCLLAATPACVRASRDTDDPKMDQKAMSTGLDRVDVEFLADAVLDQLMKTPFWARDIQGAATPATVAIWPIKNATTMHIDDQMLMMLSQLETQLVNGGAVDVVSRERQPELLEEVWVQNSDSFDQARAVELAKMWGARYYLTGKLTATDERIRRARRVQYTLFVQVLEVETGRVKFQSSVDRSKTVKGR